VSMGWKVIVLWEFEIRSKKALASYFETIITSIRNG